MMWSYPGHMGFTGGFGWIGMVLMVVFWVAVIVGVVYLVRHLIGGRPTERQASSWVVPTSGAYEAPGGAAPGALVILEERYAKGEIDQPEFLSRRADLTARR